MTAGARGAEWARQALAGRLIWQPVGTALSLWARVGWLAPWFMAFLPDPPGGTAVHPAPLLMTAALLGYFSAWLVSTLDAPGLMASAVRLAVLLAVLGLGLWVYSGQLTDGPSTGGGNSAFPWQPTWVVLLGLGLAWWRGGRTSAGEALDPDSTLRNLFAGLLMSAAAMVTFPVAAARGAGVFLPAYLGGGLAGVVLGQMYDASRRRGGRPLPFRLRWYAGLLLGVLIVVLLGVAAGAVLNTGPLWWIVSLVARLLAALGSALERVLTPLVELLIRLFGPAFDGWIAWLQGLMEGAEPTALAPAPPLSPGGAEASSSESATRLLTVVGAVLRVLLGMAGAGALLWMALRTTRRAGLEAEYVPADDIEALKAGAGSSGEGGPKRSLRAVLRLPGRARGLVHALMVRRVYAQLLEWAAREGRPRRPAETPLEFGAALARWRPALQPDLERITQAYLQVRYGERPESREMMDGVLAGWERVRRSRAASLLKEAENSQ
ncbi:MAG: DUF4129 domain-containing protein [Chloroflexi bacterium]|nr:DUF4129 domain-containing protein [Chloroflexota bacterium]